MQKGNEVGFKSLLTSEEYNKLVEKFKGSKSDFQTNHYLDTPRFSLKALDTSLRVRERDTLELTVKRKKGYSINNTSILITPEQFEEIKNTGSIPFPEIKQEITPLISEQKVMRFLSLSTFRMYLPYRNGILFIDKSNYSFYIGENEYTGYEDYELEFVTSSYHQGKKDFIELINTLEIQYKKSEKKIKRAYNLYKRLH